MNKVEEALYWIKFILIKDYSVPEKLAEEIINKSNIIDFFKEDLEMSYHTPIESWAELCYKWGVYSNLIQ